VVERNGDWLVVNVVPLVMSDGQLELGAARPEVVQAWRDGAGFVDDVLPGDIIAIHWSWACDRLSADQLTRLVQWTSHEIAVANLTI
jgi:hypothetical protein